ncbi:unnamed protein product [Enterobius vermicularis]|uniref:Secreted protein n=1 Tax=Enterobius vermicularis TaxID=51028 RepID=A0A0N4VA68_ENTVE|nr:unnamed protein product [Enterobius vermicularis]
MPPADRLRVVLVVFAEWRIGLVVRNICPVETGRIVPDVFVCQREFGVRRRLVFIAICRLLPMHAQPAVSSRPNSQNIARTSLKIIIRQFVRTVGPSLAQHGVKRTGTITVRMIATSMIF